MTKIGAEKILLHPVHGDTKNAIGLTNPLHWTKRAPSIKNSLTIDGRNPTACNKMFLQWCGDV
jgi:hypothetical protein